MDVRSGDEGILDGELAVKWDDGVVAFNYALIIPGELLESRATISVFHTLGHLDSEAVPSARAF